MTIDTVGIVVLERLLALFRKYTGEVTFSRIKSQTFLNPDTFTEHDSLNPMLLSLYTVHSKDTVLSCEMIRSECRLLSLHLTHSNFALLSIGLVHSWSVLLSFNWILSARILLSVHLGSFSHTDTITSDDSFVKLVTFNFFDSLRSFWYSQST